MAAEPRPDELSDDELWNEFHRVVNMTSHELRDWLLTRSVDEDGAVEPGTQGGVGTPTGQEVLAILGKLSDSILGLFERWAVRRWT